MKYYKSSRLPLEWAASPKESDIVWCAALCFYVLERVRREDLCQEILFREVLDYLGEKRSIRPPLR